MQKQGELQLTTAGFQLVDPSKFPEPPEGAVGWIPPEDLKATPKRGGSFRINGGWTRLDPHFPVHAADGRLAIGLYGSGLLRWDQKTNSPELDLAESWQAAPDNLSYTVKIRKGVRFHNLPPVNGRELKADDVKWNLDRISGLTRTPGQVSFHYARFETLKEVQIIDDYTVKLIMKQQDNMFLRELMFEYTLMLPKEAAINGEFGEGKTLIGTGPFMVDLAQSAGLSRFKRNPDYYDKGPDNKPYLDTIEIEPLAVQTLAPAFKTRQIDKAVSGWVALKAVLNDAALTPDLRVYGTRGNLVGVSGVGLNPNVKPLTDVRVRRAVHLGIDRDEIVNLVFDGPKGGYAPGYLGAFWQPWMWSEQKLRSLPGWKENKDEEYAEARKLLAEGGYANGLTVTCECEDAKRGEVLVQQLKRIGITVNINNISGSVLRHTSYMKDKQLSESNQGGLHTPDGAITQSYLCDSSKNMGAACDPELDKLWKEFRSTFDTDKATKLLDQMQQRMYDAMVFAPTIRYTQYHMSYKYVRGWRNAFYDCCFAHGHDMVNVWLDK